METRNMTGEQYLVKMMESYASVRFLEGAHNTAAFCGSNTQTSPRAQQLLRSIDDFCRTVPAEVREQLRHGKESILAAMQEFAKYSIDQDQKVAP